MLRFAFPVILIGIAIAGFFTFTSPLYKEITGIKSQVSAYDEALSNSKALEAERDKLTQKYNSIDPENLRKLETLLPDNVDNIRLILEVEKIAAPYGMVLKDVKYDTTTKSETPIQGAAQAVAAAQEAARKDYGIWELEFSTSGSYANFLNFIRDLEQNLRIVDVSSIEFSSESGTGAAVSNLASYKYSFTVRTYWLKN